MDSETDINPFLSSEADPGRSSETTGSMNSGMKAEPGKQPAAKTGNASFFTLAYYQGFFDVSTKVVATRIKRAIIPIGCLFFEDGPMVDMPVSLEALSQVDEAEAPQVDQGQRSLADHPADLYGPIWVTTTLVLLMSVVSKFMAYIRDQQNDTSFDVKNLTFGASFIFSYLFISSLVLFIFLNRSSVNYSFMDILCMCGYSLSIYVPATIIYALRVPGVDANLFRWPSVIVAFGVSTYFLARNVYPKVLSAATPINQTEPISNIDDDENKEKKQHAMFIVGGIAAGYLIFCAFYMYFM